MNRLALSVVFWLTAATAAHAACIAPAPGVMRIQGVVRAALSGDTVCIQTGPDHDRLTRLKLSDVAASPLTGPGGEGAKWAMRRAARGRTVDCIVMSGDTGLCRAGDGSLADRLKR